MKSFLFSLYLSVIKFVLKAVKTKPDHYVVLNGAGRSGSNGYLFYRYLCQQPNVTVTLVEPWPSSHLSWQTWRRIAQAQYLFTTHQPFKIKKNQISVSFWHGIPLKRMGLMAQNTTRASNRHNVKLWHRQADYVVSSSDFYETMMSACVGIESSHYIRTGFPRTDALMHPAWSKAKLLQTFFGQTEPDAQLGIYMPTFRFELNDPKVMAMIESGNFFAFDDFSGEALDKALGARHQYLLIKLHPYEMKLLHLSQSSYHHLYFMTNDDLLTHHHDLYEWLGSTDFLITDFSSVYLDYLRLNRPILFTTSHLAAYQHVRGFLFGPYDDVTPGPKAATQKQLLQQLSHLDPSRDEQARKRWRLLTDEMPDEGNCARIFARLAKGDLS